MSATLTPARLLLHEDGIPFSADYNDIYHSKAGGIGQARHVFLNGNDLPRRWAAREHFTILETGFGLGLNFLTTWANWQRDANACSRLHFVSIEKHPFSRDDLARYWSGTSSTSGQGPSSGGDAVDDDAIELEAHVHRLAEVLIDAWPVLLPGTHRLNLDQGRVCLTLVFGDALEVLPNLVLRADAFYLDGFAPAKNPDLWSTPIYKGLTRLAAHGASLATYTVSASVRQGLTDAGFRVDRAQGYQYKRDMLIGRFVPRYRMRRHEPPARYAERHPHAARHAIVIGAGLAGCAMVSALAARGWRITVLERGAAPATAASGNPAGVFHPIVTRDDSFAARLSRSGYFFALQNWAELRRRGYLIDGQDDGIFVCAQSDEEWLAMQSLQDTAPLPPEYAQLMTPPQAERIIGAMPARGGWYFPRGGWIAPAALCRAQLDSAGATLHTRYDCAVDRLTRGEGVWQAVGRDGSILDEAPVVILANAHDAARLSGLDHIPTGSIRGQLNRVPAAVELKRPLIGDGYVIPLDTQTWLTGASYDIDDNDGAIRASSRADNLARLRALLPEQARYFDSNDADLGARTAFRCVVSDRMPMIGALADESRAWASQHALRGAHCADLPRLPGLYGAFAYGSRGLIWAALGAEIVAALIEGEPLPVDRRLLDGIDPGRFLLRALRSA